MNRLSYIYCLILLSVISCNDNGLDCMVSDENARVYIGARIASKVTTKTPYVPTEDDNDFFDAPTYTNPLPADVWASSTPEVFEDKGLAGSKEDPTVAIHTYAVFQNSAPQLLHNLIYSKGGNPLYFTAFAPRNLWTGQDNTKATATFNGTQDLLFAPQVTGKYGNKDTNGVLVWPTLSFYHLLTWLRFEFIAESEGVSDTWGKLKDIKIISKNHVIVDLTTEFKATVPSESVTFTGDETQMPLYCTGTDTPFPANNGYKIPYLAAAEEAYVLCAAVDADDAAGAPEYTLLVTTEHRIAQVKIDLKEAADRYYKGSTRAKQFTIKLTFKVGDRITAAANIKDWENGGLIEGIVDEN